MSRWFGIAREPPPGTRRRARPLSPPCERGTRPTAGFSLVEILVALVVTGIVGAAVVQLLLQQDRFYASVDGRTFTETAVRATADLLNRELRAAAPSDLVSADAGSITLYQDSLRAAVCALAGGDVEAYVYHRVSSPELKSGTAGTFYHDVEQDTAAYLADAPDVLATGGDGSDPRDACTSGGAPSGASDDRYVQWDWPASPPPDTGAVVHVHGEVTYRLASSSFGAGEALFRNGRELVGPFTPGSTFEYRMADGTVTSDPGGSLEDVRAVLFDGRVREPEGSRDSLRRQLHLDVTLRNLVPGGAP